MRAGNGEGAREKNSAFARTLFNVERETVRERGKKIARSLVLCLM